MVEKVALTRALRETFVEDLGGMIDKDEVWEVEAEQRQTSQPIKQQKDEFQDVEIIEHENQTEIDFDKL